MTNPRDSELEALSLQELLELHASIHTAIRAAIREKNARLSMPVLGTSSPAPAQAARASIDLERDRDAWLAARRRG